MEEKIKGKKGNKKKTSLQAKVMKYTEGGTKVYNYNFNININQKAVIDNEWWDLDIIDLAIFSHILCFAHAKVAKSITDKNGEWYWVDENKILKDLPLIPLDSKSSIYKRICKLIKYGLVERNPDNMSTGLKYLRVGINGLKLQHPNPIE